jgi:hypothetical protein
MKGTIRTDGRSVTLTRATSSIRARNASTEPGSWSFEPSSMKTALGGSRVRNRSCREIDFLAAQLTQAFGRTGRARKMSDPMDRVRKAVTNRIHDAVDRIAKQDPHLGRHLHNAIRTGFSCWYSPGFRSPGPPSPHHSEAPPETGRGSRRPSARSPHSRGASGGWFDCARSSVKIRSRPRLKRGPSRPLQGPGHTESNSALRRATL